MPTVDAIARQKSLTADVSSKIFRTNIEAATQSVLIKGPMESANNMVSSNFGLRSNISEMLGTYTEERESFDSKFNSTMTSLKESADKLKESVQEERTAVRKKAQETERDRRESARKFADEARKKAEEDKNNRQERADQLAEITHERMQNSAEAQRKHMEQIAEESRERAQHAERTQRDENLQRQQIRREQNAQATVETREPPQTVAQAQKADTDITAENIRERIQRDEQSLRGRTKQLADATRERTKTAERTQRERTEKFAQEYLVAEDDTRRTNEAAQNLETTRDENSTAALSNVRNLVDRFNEAVTYFNENRGVSDRMDALAGSFSDRENLAGLNAVGITVNENGQLAVNETQLADALNQNSDGVNELLGQNGLAGRLNRNVELANSQRENLFPSVTDYVNDRRDNLTELLYAAQSNRTAELSRENASNFVNMFT